MGSNAVSEPARGTQTDLYDDLIKKLEMTDRVGRVVVSISNSAQYLQVSACKRQRGEIRGGINH